jgi:hypothetical protein
LRLACDAVSSGIQFPTFRKIAVPLSSESSNALILKTAALRSYETSGTTVTTRPARFWLYAVGNKYVGEKTNCRPLQILNTRNLAASGIGAMWKWLVTKNVFEVTGVWGGGGHKQDEGPVHPPNDTTLRPQQVGTYGIGRDGPTADVTGYLIQR